MLGHTTSTGRSRHLRLLGERVVLRKRSNSARWAADKFASEDPTCPPDEIWQWIAIAHNELFEGNDHGASPDAIVLGRRPRPLASGLLTENLTVLEAEMQDDTPAEVAARRRLRARTLYMKAQTNRRILTLQHAKSRPFHRYGHARFDTCCSPGLFWKHWSKSVA